MGVQGKVQGKKGGEKRMTVPDSWQLLSEHEET